MNKSSSSRMFVPADDVLMLMVVCFWGLTFLFTKLGLKSMDPLSFASLRVASASLILVAAWVFASTGSRNKPRMNLREHLFAAGLGFLGMASFPFCFSLAMNYTSAVNAGLIFGTTPVTVALISHLMGLERLDTGRWAGLLLSFSGVLVILLPGGAEFSFSTLGGDLLMTAAMSNWAMYTVINRFVPPEHSGLRFTAYGSVWGLVGLSLLSINSLAGLQPGEISPLSWFGGLCAGILGTAVSYVIWNNTVKSIGPAKTSVYLNLVPLISAVSGFVVLGEPLGFQHLFAGSLIIPGVIMTRGRPGRLSNYRSI